MDITQTPQRIDIKQGEAKNIPFFFNDGADPPVGLDVSDPITLSFQVKKRKQDTTILISKANADMDKAGAATGDVLVPLSKDETKVLPPGNYFSEMRAEFAAADIDKSIDIDFIVHEAVHHDA